MSELYEKLRLAVAKKGSQKAVALGLGMSEAELSRILNGERGITLNRLQEIFNYLSLIVSEKENNDDRELIRHLSRKLSEEMVK